MPKQHWLTHADQLKVVFLVAALTACQRDARSKGFVDSYRSQPDDSGIAHAKDQAQLTMAELIERLKHPPKNETEIGVQVTLAQDDKRETT